MYDLDGHILTEHEEDEDGTIDSSLMKISSLFIIRARLEAGIQILRKPDTQEQPTWSNKI